MLKCNFCGREHKDTSSLNNDGRCTYRISCLQHKARIIEYDIRVLTALKTRLLDDIKDEYTTPGNYIGATLDNYSDITRLSEEIITDDGYVYLYS